MSAPTRVIVIGAGGHGLVAGDVLQRMASRGSTLHLTGYLDDDVALLGALLNRATVIGPVTSLDRHDHDAVFLGIGRNDVRRDLFLSLKAAGETFITLIHPTAVLAAEHRLGVGTLVCANVVVNPRASIGDNVILNTACSVDHHCAIGDHTHIGPGVRLGGGVTIGRGCLVGIGGVVLPNVTIGDGAVVGAGAVVTSHVGAGTTVVGVPARIPK